MNSLPLMGIFTRVTFTWILFTLYGIMNHPLGLGCSLPHPVILLVEGGENMPDFSLSELYSFIVAIYSLRVAYKLELKTQSQKLEKKRKRKRKDKNEKAAPPDKVRG